MLKYAFAAVFAVVSAAGCVSRAPAAPAVATPRPDVQPQAVAELDRLIEQVQLNLQATRTSAEQSEAYKRRADEQLAELRGKLAVNGAAADAAKSNADAPVDDAVQRAVAAFEAKAAYAAAVAQLREAQVDAREARLRKLKLQRAEMTAPPAAAAATRLELDAARSAMAAADTRVSELKQAQELARSRWEESRASYQAARGR